MYVSYFVCFLGISILIQSWLFFSLLLIFQISAHWIIRSEERWCLQQFGKAYQDYQERVGRYI
jgi:protein-S-isoprenylcysteine O-methyltransferase Ste14